MAFYIRKYHGLEWGEFELEIITPLFLAGADTNKPELRATAIKGALRFWWRALHPNLPLAKLKEDESVKRSTKAQMIIKKNINILERRLKKIDNIRANLSALDAQIETIEDILGLFHDQMLTLRNPGDISSDLDELITNVQLTQEAIEETDSFMNEFRKLEETKQNLRLK